MTQAGLDRIGPRNPPPLPGARCSWLLWRHLEPVGLWSYRLVEPGVVELALNTWRGVSPGKLLLEWLAGIPAERLLARVFVRNREVKRLLQRAGFMLLGSDGRVELYGVEKAHLLQVTRRVARRGSLEWGGHSDDAPGTPGGRD